MRVIILVVAFLALTASHSIAESWLLEEVTPDNTFPHSSIVVDAGHVPHVAATNWSNGDVNYYSRGLIAGVWQPELIINHGSVLGNRALRLDANGYARVVMEGKIAIQSGNGWTVNNAPGGFNWWQAMAIDQNTSRVTYIWSVGSGSYTGGFAYENQAVVPNAFLPSSPSCEMDFDGNGNLYIVAMLDLGMPVQLWRQSGSGWVAENIGVGAWPSIAIDHENSLHVCYYAYPSRDLVHAVRNAEDSWTTTPIETDGDVGVYPSLAIDALGRLNASYYDATRGDLRFARSSDDGATWTRVTVHSVGNVGTWSSLAVDGETVHISYNAPVTENASRLHYARLTGPLTAVDNTPRVRRAAVRAVPNPFNPSTRIEYVVPVRGRVQVTVFDAAGRVVEKLVDEDRAPGEYRVQYRARTATGVYFVRVDVGGHSATTKIVLLK